jgi:hypothetical protein
MDMKFFRSTEGKTTLSGIKVKFWVVGAQNLLEEKQLKWFGHIKRMDRTRTPRRPLELKLKRKRPIG